MLRDFWRQSLLRFAFQLKEYYILPHCWNMAQLVRMHEESRSFVETRALPYSCHDVSSGPVLDASQKIVATPVLRKMSELYKFTSSGRSL